METKKWYVSRTLWVNVVAMVAIIVQTVTGNDLIDANVQAGILALINLVLRIITKQPLI